MKIISRFKDYYDYYSNIYGIDEKINYNRKLFNKYDSIFKEIKKTEFRPVLCYTKWEMKYIDYDFYWLIVCGRQFLIYKKNSDPNFTLHILGSELDELLPHKKKGSFWDSYSNTPIEYYYGFYTDKNLQLNIQEKSPIIVLNPKRNEDFITSDSPILGTIKNFVSLYPADKIYQDICYFFLNQIHGSADINVPVELDDKYKIQYHGFDKISFRPKSRFNNHKN